MDKSTIITLIITIILGSPGIISQILEVKKEKISLGEFFIRVVALIIILIGLTYFLDYIIPEAQPTIEASQADDLAASTANSSEPSHIKEIPLAQCAFVSGVEFICIECRTDVAASCYCIFTATVS